MQPPILFVAMQSQLILILLGLLVIISIPFGLGSFLARWTWLVLFYTLTGPYWLWVWYRNRQTAQQRRRNYEFLGKYVALLGNNPETLRYFRHLIEEGIPEADLARLLEENLHNLKTVAFQEQKQRLQEKMVEEEAMQQLSAQQQELLAQSRVSLEQIKFREKLLDQLYQKIRKKYRL